MADFYTKQDDKITHGSIVHELLKKIVTELAVKEFRGGYKKPVVNNGITYMDYISDSRTEYIQSIEVLSDFLLPQYDETMAEVAEKYYQNIEEIEKELEGKDVRMGDDNHNILIRKKLKLVRQLFRDLNLLLKRTNYLKVSPRIEKSNEEE